MKLSGPALVSRSGVRFTQVMFSKSGTAADAEPIPTQSRSGGPRSVVVPSKRERMFGTHGSGTIPTAVNIATLRPSRLQTTAPDTFVFVLTYFHHWSVVRFVPPTGGFPPVSSGAISTAPMGVTLTVRWKTVPAGSGGTLPIGVTFTTYPTIRTCRTVGPGAASAVSFGPIPVVQALEGGMGQAVVRCWQVKM